MQFACSASRTHSRTKDIYKLLEQLADDTFLWWLPVPINLADLIQCDIIPGEEPTMHNLKEHKLCQYHIQTTSTYTAQPMHPNIILTRTRVLRQCANGSQLNTSPKSSDIWAVYFAFTSPSNPYIWFILWLSWLPEKKSYIGFFVWTGYTCLFKVLQLQNYQMGFIKFNPLMPSSYYMYHLLWHTKILHSAHKACETVNHSPPYFLYTEARLNIFPKTAHKISISNETHMTLCYTTFIWSVQCD